MKHQTKIYSCLTLAMVAGVAQADGYLGTREGEYYFGADLQYLFVKPKIEYKKFFKQQQPGIDLYLGYRLNRSIGFEVGSGWTTRVSKETSFAVGQKVFDSFNVNQSTDITGKIRYKNTHFDLNGYYPINKHFDGIISVGVGFLRPSVRITSSNPASNLNDQVVGMSSKTNAMVRFGLGLEGMLGDYWGMRSIVRYENTSRVSVRGAGIGGSRFLKDGVSVAFGFYRYLD